MRSDRAERGDLQAIVTEPASAMPDATAGTVSLADEEGVKRILVGTMWSELVQWARAHMLDPRLPVVNPEDLSIPRCAATADGLGAPTTIRDGG